MFKPEKSLPNELLKYERERHNLSQQEVVDKLKGHPTEQWEKVLYKEKRDIPREDKKVNINVRTVRRWETGEYIPSPYYLRRLEKIFQKTAQELGYPPEGTDPRIPFWYVPHDQPSQTEFFMSREDYLLRLHSVIALRNQQYGSDEKMSAAKTEHVILKPQALVGLGGIGKTQIAIEYAYRYAYEYQTVIWLRANSYELLAADFANIATIVKVNLPQKDLEDQPLRIKAVKDWLMHFTRWLLIFDDAEDVEVIRDFLLPKCFGHIIVTTRSAATGKLAQAIEVENIPLDVATSFLLRRSKVIEPKTLGTEAREIAKLFDGLPLMLEQAGAYIETTGCGLAGYLADYKAQGAQLRKKPKLPEKEYPHTVATAWQMSFKKVSEADPVAADLLSLFAFLSPDAIPEEIITVAAEEFGSVLSVLKDNATAFNDALAELRKYSLVKRHEETKTCSIHNLVQAVFRDEMDEETKRLWVQRLAQAVNSLFLGFIPEAGSMFPLGGLQKERYLPHALVCRVYAEQLGVESPEISELVLKTESYLKSLLLKAEWRKKASVFFGSILAAAENVHDRYYKASEWFYEFGQLQEKLGGDFQTAYDYAKKFLIDGLRMAAAAANEVDAVRDPQAELASLSEIENSYTEVESSYTETELRPSQTIRYLQKLVPIVFDPNTILVEEGRNKITSFFTDQSVRAEVESAYQQILVSSEEFWGPESPQVATALIALGKLCLFYEDVSEAALYLQRALEIRLKAFGEKHPDVADSYNLMARLSALQGKEEQAEDFYKKAIVIGKEAAGTEHPKLCDWLHDLGEFYYKRGRYHDAMIYYLDALKMLVEQMKSRRTAP